MTTTSARTSGRTSGRQTSDERRAALIEAALPAFAVAGLHGTAVSTVSEAVGITQPYVFSLFGTKRGLFLATVESCFDRIAAVFQDAAAAAPEHAMAAERLSAMGQAYRDLLADRTVLQFQMQCFAACGDDDVRALVRGSMERLFDLVRELSGATSDEAREFLGRGMLCNLSATLDLDLLLPTEIADGECAARERRPRVPGFRA